MSGLDKPHAVVTFLTILESGVWLDWLPFRITTDVVLPPLASSRAVIEPGLLAEFRAAGVLSLAELSDFRPDLGRLLSRFRPDFFDVILFNRSMTTDGFCSPFESVVEPFILSFL